ncbi:hypothetical protein QLL95_gp1162 [Cotonvirus japonicus]|uniref:ADP ribosyltransferase domain-containing protein n=1 Tax=Cotonvirus japonicus TaxID=2811091 RepID=A0ABM7NS38_9VIRU|nr:hypothetical protein QLL95_gp1162 [Cotonvirus japonicus]BCS82961.1 hypothetical protein [Cotonvirus japonicus]
MLYYYILVSNPYIIESTECLDDLITMLYDGVAEFISKAQIIELKLNDNYLDDLRREISEYENRVPLYDITSGHIFLIDQKNVYPDIYFFNYRFIDDEFYKNLLSLKNPNNVVQENIRILSHYNFSILYITYMKLFYNSFVINSYITNCQRPSFASGMEHIQPYYTINELYYLAYDWNLTTKTTLNDDEIRKFCSQISKFDISAKTLLDHQIYIYDSKAIGLVKHYSLFGSYYMNSYLRKYKCCLPNFEVNKNAIRNIYLENQIEIMIRLIKNAPEFTKSYTVYRFVESDNYLQHLNVGDIYQDASFMSTTRNPFYYKENYAFGYILIKITLPKNIKGIGLCIESYSNFPNEEEIVLPPTSKYKLVSYNDKTDVAHFQNIFGIEAQKKYEFEWVGNDYVGKPDSVVSIDIPGAYIPETPIINLSDLLHDENIKYLEMSDRLKYFRDTFVNVNNQFGCVIGNNEYIFNMESYDATSVYKPFFYYERSDGIMVTTSNPKYGNINILMELGSEIHVNYYFKYSVTDPSIVVDLNRPEWIEWLSLFAYAIGSKTVVIHSNYVLKYNKNDSVRQKQLQTRYTFSQNIYQYLKSGIKMFVFDEISPKFDYSRLDFLFGYSVNDVIKSTDKNELYRVTQSSGKTNMGDLYLYIVENFPKLISTIEEKMDVVYDYNDDINPFKNISYILNPWTYLLDKSFINYIPPDKEFPMKMGSFKKLIGPKKIVKFQNRLRTYLIAN